MYSPDPPAPPKGHIFDIGALECSNVHSDLLRGMSQPPIIVPAGKAACDLQGGYRIVEGYLPPAYLRKGPPRAFSITQAL